MWHKQDSQGQILALAFRQKSFKYYEFLPVRSQAGYRLKDFCITQL